MVATSQSIRPPGRLSLLREIRLPFELSMAGFGMPRLALMPRGDGRPVVLLPGLMADDRYMAPLAAYLTFLGYDARCWGLGLNRGNVEGDVARVAASLAEAERPVALVGWSLGGVIAREVARQKPDRVREVITFGTPIVGGPKYTSMGQRFAERRQIDLDAFEDHVDEINRMGLAQPITSIYSKSDGIVAWRASIDRFNAHAKNIEVRGTHLGLGLNAQVWRVIAKRLAETRNLV